MNLILLLVSVVFAVANNIMLHKYSEHKNTINIFAFNAGVSVIWLIVLIIWGGSITSASSITLIFGLLNGLTIFLFLLFKMSAMGSGPVSITAMVGCCSLIIPTLYGLIRWNEAINILQISGLALLFISLYLCINPKADAKVSKKWILMCVLFFIFAGINGVIIKMYGKIELEPDLNSMLIITAITASLIFTTIGTAFYYCKKLKKIKLKIKFSKQERVIIFVYIMLCGLASCFYQRLNLYLAYSLPSLIFFPIFNGGVIFLSGLTGVIFLKEKLSRKQLTGLLLGAFSIMLIGNVFNFVL